MGRIRTIKPEAFLDEELWDAEIETGLPLFRAFTGLWTQADREGRFQWRPRKLKAAILPYWEGDFSRVLDALTTRRFVVKYASNDDVFGWVRTFTKHQIVNNREVASEIPPPPAEATEYAVSTRAPRVDDACPTALDLDQVEQEGKGKEGKGTEKSAPRSIATRLPDDFTLTNERWDVGKAEGLADIERTFAKFCDHWRSAAGAKGRKTDWDATWRNWCRNEIDYRGKSNGRRDNGSHADDRNRTQRRIDRLLDGQ